MQKLRLRLANQLASGHAVCQWGSWDFESDPKASIISPVPSDIHLLTVKATG